MSIRRLFLALLLVMPACAQAADVYVGFGLGSGVDASALDSSSLDPESSGTPFKILAGVRFLRFLGVEAAYYDFGDEACCREVADFGFATSTNGYSVAVVGRLPVGPRLSVFGKIGTLAWNEDGTIVTLLGPDHFSDDGVDLLTGVGLGIHILFGLEVRGEWERYELGGHTVDGFWGTVVYRF